MTTAPRRDYGEVRLECPEDASREHRMRAVVDGLWRTFQRREEGDRGISWVGFYYAPGQTFEGRTVGPDEMILIVRQPKPACSPLSIKGACGRCWRTRRPLVVSDVKNLGEGYVACDPRDRSEVVVPCLDGAGRCFAVLDIDSFDVGAFSTDDAEGLTSLLRRAGLTSPDPASEAPIVV